MRPLSLARLALGLLLGLAWMWTAAVSHAQQTPKPRTATFKTKDHVELQGTFYPSAKGRDAYCVLLLHNIGGNMQKGNWDTLAQELQKEEFAVLAFDFRGHGNSKNVSPGSPASGTLPAKPGFWDFPFSQQASRRPINPQQRPKTIDQKDFDPRYLPMLANDIAAAKLFLDERNDAMDCNSSRLIIVGAQDAAALGMLWMVTECYRHRVLQRPAIGMPLKLNPDSEADALAAALWLSATGSIGTGSSGAYNIRVREWLELLGQKHEIPMGFLYGDGDKTDETFANRCVQILQKASKNKLTAEKAIKKANLKGADLLNKELNTTETIVNYLKLVREERKGPAWKAKKTSETGFMWAFPGAAQPIEAKGEKEEVMNFLPVSQLLGRP